MFVQKPAEVLEIEQAQRDFTFMLRMHHAGEIEIDEVIEYRNDIFALAKKYDYFIGFCEYEWWRWQPWMEELRWNWWSQKSC